MHGRGWETFYGWTSNGKAIVEEKEETRGPYRQVTEKKKEGHEDAEKGGREPE